MMGKLILVDNDIQIIITDQRMPRIMGIELLESIIEQYPDPIRPAYCLPAMRSINAVIDAINKRQVYRHITKPWNEDDLRMNIENAYEVYKCCERRQIELTEKAPKGPRAVEFVLAQRLLS